MSQPIPFLWQLQTNTKKYKEVVNKIALKQLPIPDDEVVYNDFADNDSFVNPFGCSTEEERALGREKLEMDVDIEVIKLRRQMAKQKELPFG